MWLMICEPTDYSALWLYGELEKIGVDNITLLTPDELMFGATWELHDGYEGTSFLITLDDSKIIHSTEIKGIINRITSITIGDEHNDARYIDDEWNAFFLCWLSCLDCIILNPPQPDSIIGFWQEPAVLQNTLYKAGLKSKLFTLGENNNPNEESLNNNRLHVIALNGIVMNDSIDDSIKEGVEKLSKLIDFPLMGITFDFNESEQWCVSSINNFPYFELGKEKLIGDLGKLIKDN